MTDPTRTIPAPPSMPVDDTPLALGDLTTEQAMVLLSRAAQGKERVVALLPVGSVEPHGPHLPLSTDTLLSDEVCRRAAVLLRAGGVHAVIAPAISYGITRYAQGFRGTLTISEETLVALVREVVSALLDDGFTHVVVVNNHLEPAHVAALDKAVKLVCELRGPSCATFANQLEKRFARTLTDEFKRGDCHAGRYETSLVLASRPELVRADVSTTLPTVTVSLAQAIKAAGGAEVRFSSIGMPRAYTGAPSEASADEGDDTYEKLVDMVVTLVNERLQEAGEDTARGSIP